MSHLPGPAWLFCPADRPDRYEKAAAAGDVVILDLEDAVAPENKPVARAALTASTLDPARTIARVDPRASGHQELDLEALQQTDYRYVMVPKAEAVEDLDAFEGYALILLCETPAGVLRAPDLARDPRVIALTWGAEDLVAALGGTSSRDSAGAYRDVALHARSRVLLAAGAAGKAAVDTTFLTFDDDAGLARAAADAHASGFEAVMCIHPRQVPVIRAAYAPSAEQVRWAREVLAVATSSGAGVFSFEGQMIDEPVLRQARQILERNER